MDIKRENEGTEDIFGELKRCLEEREEYLNGWKRAKADFINYKRDEEERISRMLKFANEGLVSELLMVLDSFDLGVCSVKDEGTKKGLELIKMQFENALEKYGLVRIESPPGERFDPQKHEVVGETEAESGGEEWMVGEEVKKGYIFNGKIIRPAKVKVTKTKSKL